MSARIRYRPAQSLVVWALCAVSIFLVPLGLPRESLRSELIHLQKQTVFTLVSGRENKIYAVSFANGKLTKPTIWPGRGIILSGGFSEDGSRVAVALCGQAAPPHCFLAIVDKDGSHPHEYPNLGNPSYMACWSRDSSKIAIVAQNWRDGSHTNELLILDVATGGTQLIGRGSTSFVDPQCWSPGDKQVVYTSDNMSDHPRSSIYDVESKALREFSVGTRPTWSPDGNWIALMDCPPSLWGCKYFVVRPSGSERKFLFKSEAATALWWSPDSRLVAYVNGAGFFERTPPQQLREMVRLRVRRLEDGSVDSFADFFDGDMMEFQWVKYSEVNAPSPP